MDYGKLATELLSNMVAVQRLKSQKNINEALHGELFALSYIASQGEHVNPSEISGNMNVSKARITTTLNSLEKKGLITRQIDTSNRSRILVGITGKGKDLAEEHQKTVLEMVTKMLKLLGKQDAKDYVRIMQKMATLLPDFEDKE